MVKKAACNGTVCDHHDSSEILVLLYFFLLKCPTLYVAQSDSFLRVSDEELTLVLEFNLITRWSRIHSPSNLFSSINRINDPSRPGSVTLRIKRSK